MLPKVYDETFKIQSIALGEGRDKRETLVGYIGTVERDGLRKCGIFFGWELCQHVLLINPVFVNSRMSATARVRFGARLNLRSRSVSLRLSVLEISRP